jgi:hypothetical protein
MGILTHVIKNQLRLKNADFLKISIYKVFYANLIFMLSRFFPNTAAAIFTKKIIGINTYCCFTSLINNSN